MRLLLLSVGYGQGHHSAAAALAEEFACRGWETRTIDPCALGSPRIFRITQEFYNFCVRRLPWLWGVTYSCTDTADWSAAVDMPVLARCMRVVQDQISQWHPDFIICTYPLYAYMLDALADRGGTLPPYAVVVTDAREISRPWMLSRAPLVCVPDSGSRRSVLDCFGLDAACVEATGFPVRRVFAPSPQRRQPDVDHVNLVYGAYCSTRRVCRDIKALAAAFPAMDITVLAGKRHGKVARLLAQDPACVPVRVLGHTDRMPELFASAHIYVGKAGAATVFEAYAACVPLVVNFALPGQEQGNLELLLEDGAGEWVDSTGELVHAVRRLLQDGAALWASRVAAMRLAARSAGAPHVADEVEKRFFRDYGSPAD